MEKKTIDRIAYRYSKKNLDFEILDLQDFYRTRPASILSRDFRLEFWMMLYIIDGKGVHSVDFNDYPYKKGDIIFVQMNQVHRFLVNPKVRGYIIHINEPFFYRIKGFDSDIFMEFIDKAFGSPVLSFDTGMITTNRMLIDLIYKEYNRSEESMSPELIATLFQGFILSLRQQMNVTNKILVSKDYEHFREYRGLVEDHFKESRNVEEYADMMHLSKKTVNQATRNIVGLSAKQFIINRVILEIKRYLSQGELMNFEIADELGFAEAANMTKFFKRYEGISPKAFRESLISEG